ncbi:porin family protein [Chishuiella changwenlii]|uniref:porin family protein n=1 Tax=Chishuiella changwenlii TaxID=1434701 RepID=UPI002FDB92FF
MKKILLLLPLLVLTINANAQTKFGVKGGMNVSNLRGEDENADAKIGLYAGGYATIKIDDKFAFQPEVLYSAQGAKQEGNLNVDGIGNAFAKVKYKVDYINIPLMFKYYATEGLSIEAGPQVGLLVSSKMNVKGHVLSSSQQFDTTVDAKDLFKSVDFGLNVGLGYELSNGINFGARYNFGLANISDVGGKIKNSVFSFGLGYSFK